MQYPASRESIYYYNTVIRILERGLAAERLLSLSPSLFFSFPSLRGLAYCDTKVSSAVVVE